MPCVRCDTKEHAYHRWAGVLLTAAVLELVALRRHNHRHTLSHVTRYTFRTHTRAGRLTFSLAWTMLYLWLFDHIVRSVHNASKGVD